ncbi:MAG: prolipoprotein diacylglyceryl transferase [Cyclobacteriaceae bacterium]|nr:prolipoprotein diacylglyceryl transferase [Cyclobacteriaceae bacterium]
MHPVLFEFDTPNFLRGFFPDTIGIYTYGFLIACGASLGYLFTRYQAKKQFNASTEVVQTMVIIIIAAAVVGGKLFIFFEDPERYWNDPLAIFRNFSTGFVFYGSLLLAIPSLLLYVKASKIPALPMLDIIAITACIVHGFGRLGCFMAGCCYGLPHEGWTSVTFTHPRSSAEPLFTPLHPTQLYDAFSIFTIMAILLFLSKRKQFHGQIFLVYLMLYAIGRSVIEIFRGDVERGFIIENVLSNSQLISGLLFLTALFFYVRLRKSATAAP